MRFGCGYEGENQQKITESMTIKELIENISSVENDYSVAFAKKIDGDFRSNSEIIIAEIDEESEEDIKKTVLGENPQFDYFLEVFLIKEMVQDFLKKNDNIDQLVDIVIHYAKHDA